MNDLDLLPGAQVIWRDGQPHPGTPWTSLTPDNPLYHPFWSWKTWGRKIILSYWVSRPASLGGPERQPRPAHA